MTRTIPTTALLFVVACGSLAGGCAPPSGSGTAAAPEAAAPPSPAPPSPPSAEVAAKLSAADRADGQADHVVARCPGCGLAMEGSPDFALETGDYALHFCSESCRDAFSENLQASLLALTVPEAPGEPALADPVD